jgi:hypothetical protein
MNKPTPKDENSVRAAEGLKLKIGICPLIRKIVIYPMMYVIKTSNIK